MNVLFCTCLIFCAFLSTVSAADELDLNQRALDAQDLIFAEKYERAEVVIRECLKVAPKDLNLLSKLDIALNGQGKYPDADNIRDQIREIWIENHRDKWLADGSPVARATWARMVVQTKNYFVIGVEYYQPEVIGTDFPITSFYKIIVHPKIKGDKPRVFKLEMSNLDRAYYVLRELYLKRGGGAQIISYGSKKPEFRQVLRAAVRYLISEET
jgi:hypothetical protein